jgi:DNA-binding NtrC family response regulator
LITEDGVRRAFESVNRRPRLGPRLDQTVIDDGAIGRALSAYMNDGYREGLEDLRREFTRRYISRELDRAHGNKKRAAVQMGIDRPRLYELMKLVGMEL